jgi:hypothetical protein
MLNQVTTLLTYCLLLGLLSGCNTKAPPTAAKPQHKQLDRAPYKGLHGTWARYSKYGFTLIEITDTAHVLYYQFSDRRKAVDTVTHDRYWYYKSSAKMGYWGSDSLSIWILTDQFRFDYRVEKNGDLTEHDKMGDQGTFVKVPKHQG